MPHSHELARCVEAPGQARRLLAEWVGEDLDPAELDRAKLVLSELVTNAVVHGAGAIQLHVDLDEHRLLIEVVDEGRGFEHVVREIPFKQLSGRGLAIVEGETSRWGIHEGTTHVWAELDRTHVWAELERPGPRVGEEAKPESPETG